jgi:DNA polymerase-3 subunit gamma/tau
VIGLLLAAQTDMRWTTSPRLTLELALIRATIPETDTAPQGLVARLERLERIAGVVSGVATEPAPSDPVPDPVKEQGTEPLEQEQDRVPDAPESVPEPPVLGAGTSAIDIGAIRRSWASMIQSLRTHGKAVLPSFLETATPGAYDGETLELVFPPDRPFGVKKVTEREQELRAALQETFGITPQIRCVLREGIDRVEVIEDDPPLSEEEALARIKAELGAQESES